MTRYYYNNICFIFVRMDVILQQKNGQYEKSYSLFVS